MNAIAVLLALFLAAVLYLMFDKKPESFVHSSPVDWKFAGNLIDGNEISSNEFGIKTAKDCRALCHGKCVATKFIHDYEQSGSNACEFFDSYSGTVASSLMPSDDINGVWLRN